MSDFALVALQILEEGPNQVTIEKSWLVTDQRIALAQVYATLAVSEQLHELLESRR